MDPKKMNKTDKDFLNFVKLLHYMNLINPMVINDPMAILNLKNILCSKPEEFRIIKYAVDEKTSKIYDLLKEIYEYYLLYGGMVLENNSDYRGRFMEIMGIGNDFMSTM